ncbi:ABC transporter ATP-binding protein [Streptomyces anthocyanicus]|uniref:ABC transporter ATP-binding protein n=1 Tax=Streptomyces anthocyanicus TaxID=68174 RepID=UPI002E343A12|nr:ATP-binding cassette domain-containing protein [Streptomyces anthocyanicus]
MIDAVGLSKKFGNRTLWQSVNFTVRQGEMLALTGPSGSGKSTLLNCLGLLEKPTSGVIHCQGEEVTAFRRGEIQKFRRSKLGYLFQSYALIENATILENMEVAVKPRRWLRNKSNAAIAEALDRVGMAGRSEEMIHHLSGGEQQRVALARIMVQQPALILADEPTGALDSANAAMVVDTLRDMSKTGCAVVIATHDADVSDRCDDVFALTESSSATLP